MDARATLVVVKHVRHTLTISFTPRSCATTIFTMYIFNRFSLSRFMHQGILLFSIVIGAVLVAGVSSTVSAQTLPPGFVPLTTENPRSNSFGMEGTIAAPPPTEGARIIVPSGGQTFNQPIITVSGVCPSGLLVELLNNGVMVGSTFCEDGSFALQISLFPGQNELSAKVRDDLGQEGPDSNTVTVQYNTPDAEFSAFAEAIILTSAFSRRAANPGSTLIWPLQLSGGTGPYAFSINWGDGTEPQLISQSTAGIVNISHVYQNPGIYRVTIRVTDSNGITGFLQVIAVANGAAEAAIVDANEQPERVVIRTRILWIPAAVVLLLMIPAFWLGRRHEARAMRKRLERDAEMIRKLDT